MVPVWQGLLNSEYQQSLIGAEVLANNNLDAEQSALKSAPTAKLNIFKARLASGESKQNINLTERKLALKK